MAPLRQGTQVVPIQCPGRIGLAVNDVVDFFGWLAAAALAQGMLTQVHGTQ
jgi:hypothetical protein